MNTIISCIDGSSTSVAVCDASAWASQRLNAPLKLLHVLDRSELPAEGDLSGNIGLGSREHLLQELTALDEQRARLALEHGKHMLEEAKLRAESDGAVDISTVQRHGSLVETLQDLELQTRLLVIGRQGEGHESMAYAVGSQLESVVRALHCPILVAVGGEFRAPSNFMFAYDGSRTADKALKRVIDSPLLVGMPCHLVSVTPEPQQLDSQQLQNAAKRLSDGGFEVAVAALSGEVQESLGSYQRDKGIELGVMGAYGHSRIRQFFVGSNTTKMVASSDVPLLLLR